MARVQLHYGEARGKGHANHVQGERRRLWRRWRTFAFWDVSSGKKPACLRLDCYIALSSPSLAFSAAPSTLLSTTTIISLATNVFAPGTQIRVLYTAIPDWTLRLTTSYHFLAHAFSGRPPILS